MTEASTAVQIYQFPLSFAQERLWFLHQFEGDNVAYNISAALQLEGPLDPAALQRALDTLVARHEILRTLFVSDGGLPTQRVTPSLHIAIERVWFADSDLEARKARAQAYFVERNRRPFDLSQGPLLRVTLVELDHSRSHALSWLNLCIHHIIADAWSVGVIVRELAALYRAALRHRPCELPPPALQYADFAVWQRERLQGETLRQELDFWRSQLQGAPALVNLPLDYPRTQQPSPDADCVRIDLPARLAHQARHFAGASGASLYMVLLAAFNVLIGRLSGQQDVVVGSLIANRNQADVEALVGFFVNTLPLRCDLSDDPNFRELVRRVKHTALNAYNHQDLPFERMVEALQPERDLSFPPLIQLLFVLQNAPMDAFELEGVQVTPLRLPQPGQIRFDLEVYGEEDADGFHLDFWFRSQLLHKDSVQRMARQYLTLLEAALNQPQRPVMGLPMLDRDQYGELSRGLFLEAQPYPDTLCIHQLFERRAERHPELTAVMRDGRSLSYGELNRRANRLAHLLIGRGIKLEDRIGICLDRSLDMVVALLAVFKAGASYAPLDPAYPTERIAYMLEDSGARLTLTQQTASGRLPENVATLMLDDLETLTSACEDSNPQHPVAADNLAYVIYTSGSTGLPKGVAIEHRSVGALIHWAQTQYHLEELEEVLATTSICFDLSVFEIFVTLCSGGRVHLADNMTALAERAGDLDAYSKVSLINTVPSAIQALLRANAVPPQVRTVNLAGEPLKQELVEQLYALPHIRRVYDLYGPSEDTTYSTCALRRPGGKANIGRPISNTLIHIIDENLQLVPRGVAGELLIGGRGLARGYLGKPELTAQRFIANPFSGDLSERLYRTGDLVRVNSDDQLEYLGRIDQQVKVRGFRIELGEIESCINNLRDNSEKIVKDGVVSVIKDDNLGPYLAAYVVGAPGRSIDADDLKRRLARRLPGYMVPEAIITLDAIPLTANGKTDRKALPIPQRSARETEYVAPGNGFEQAVADVWGEVLQQEVIGVRDNFFQLGGHSLLATQIIARLNQRFGASLTVRNLFECPNVAELAALVRERSIAAMETSAEKAIRRTPTGGARRASLAPAQMRLWFLSKIDGGSSAYNLHMTVRINGELHADRLQEAFACASARHEILRTTFHEDDALGADGAPYQRIHPELPCEFLQASVESHPSERREAEAERLAVEAAQTPFDLSRGPLVRVLLVRLAPRRHVMLLAMHHIISDGWSIGVLFNEVKAFYQAINPETFALDAAATLNLPPLSLQYADYAAEQILRLERPEAQRQLEYWRTQLADAPPLLELPHDRPRPAQADFAGDTLPFHIDSGLTAALRRFADAAGASLFMVSCAAFAALMKVYSRQRDIVIGAPVANRTRPELEPLIGFFVNTLALRIRSKEDFSFNELLKEVKTVSLDAYEHQDPPFNKVVESLELDRALNHNPLFQVMFVLQNAPTVTRETPDLEITPFPIRQQRAAFDLLFSLTESQGRMHGEAVYNRTLFDRASIERMLEVYLSLLELCVNRPDEPVLSLPLAAPAEIPAQPAQTPVPLPALIQDQCERTPDLEALSWTPQATALTEWSRLNSHVSYGEFARLANQAADWLREQGVASGDVMALWLPRSPELFVLKYAALKMGVAYAPIDPELPLPRVRQMVESAAPRLLVAVNAQHGWEDAPCAIAPLPQLWAQLSRRRAEPPPLPDPNCIAYILYTSGSTGAPKGVAMPQRALSNLVVWHRQHPRLSAPSRTLQFAAIGFDVCFQEFAATLACGGSLVLCPPRLRQDPRALMTFIREQGVERLFLPFVALQQLAETLTGNESGQNPVASDSLRDVVTAGEQLQITAPVRRFFRERPHCRLHNHYGPTEAHVVSALQLDDQPERWPVLPGIGAPLCGVQLHIFNQLGQPAPAGAPGELYIGGVCLAQGYVGRDDLTAERFITTTLMSSHGEISQRLYRTGDLARRTAQGEFLYLGRIDEQVKIRGFRVEPGEVEAVLNSHDDIKAAAVIARDDGAGMRLLAYVEPRQTAGFDIADLRAWLRKRLPDYMAPARILTLEKMPVTVSGKINRRALPAPDALREAPELLAEPRSALERSLHDMWSELLGLPHIDILANFFELGGHSLLVTRLLNRIRARLSVDATVRDVFENPSIAELAERLAALAPAASDDDERLCAQTRPAAPPLSFAQERLWFLHQLEGAAAGYNMPIAMELKGPLDDQALHDSFRDIIARHEVLRTRFHMAGDAPVQEIHSDTAPDWRFFDLSALPEPERVEQVRELARLEANYAFDLESDRLLRIRLVQLEEQRHVLLATMHHIIFDGWSNSVFVRELQAFYHSRRTGSAAGLPPMQLQYADFACWQRRLLTPQRVQQHLDYWRQELQDAPEAIRLPRRPHSEAAGLCALAVQDLPAPTVTALQEFNRQQGSSLYMTMLAAFAALLQRLSGQSDIVVGTTVANRNRQELESLIGFFVNSLPIRLRLDASASFLELLTQARDKTLQAQAHQELPFDLLVRSLQTPRVAGRQPIFQVVFDFQNGDAPASAAPPKAVFLDDLEVSYLPGQRGSAKYDLVLSVSAQPEQVRIVFEYDRERFTAEEIAALQEHYLHLLDAAAQRPGDSLLSLAGADGKPATGEADAAEEFDF
ncbi:amino acid adenylation domain-containing protein [Hahella aquimaris]|uniref:amino acid adenylation domain-containing protein n=1 Tax=Hahella sp. HNIBRBA332 TaxID=3015983 RepID=UPI00273CB3F2|nr:non-ribosomal peptide synthetase [Hahella sp. HNIBRBA332]WLQ16686.1 amino acid adenylation domain-containing protein [Hahella sp. HNIBRBA332]